jgi:peptidoglycan/LPS O-acetylase OafA/YrhL
MTYLPALSGLRGIACLAVLAFHTRLSGVGGGFLGVDVFFVLSGFLTVSILDRLGTDITWRDAARFMERRVRRILPLLTVVCCVVSIALLFTGNASRIPYELLSPLGFYSNFAIAFAEGPDFLGHSWSLSAEMQFYALAAILFLITAPLGRRVTLPLFATIFIAMTLARYSAFSEGLRWTEIYYAPHYHVSGLFLGGVIALLPRNLAGYFKYLGAPALVVLVLGFSNAVFLSAVSFSFWSTTTEIAAGLLILSILGAPASMISNVLGHRYLEKLGLWSYGIYLWHFPVAKLVRENMGEIEAFALTLGVSISLAVFTYRHVEQRYTLRHVEKPDRRPQEYPQPAE